MDRVANAGHQNLGFDLIISVNLQSILNHLHSFMPGVVQASYERANVRSPCLCRKQGLVGRENEGDVRVDSFFAERLDRYQARARHRTLYNHVRAERCQVVSFLQHSLGFLARVISFDVRPYLTMSSWCSPDSPKVSLTPTLEMGTGYDSVMASATAPPKPPITFCSSAVTSTPVFLATRTIVSESSGFTVWESTTSAETPVFERVSAASIASLTIMPQAMIPTSDPSLSILACPTSTSLDAEYIVGTLGLLRRM